MKNIINKKGEAQWTKKATNFLLKNYKTMTLKKLSKSVGAPCHLLRHKLLENGLTEPKSQFTAAQRQFLIANYQIHPYTQIATAMGKTFKEVKSEAEKLNLKKEKPCYSPERKTPYKNKKGVQDHYYTHTYKQIAQILNIHVQAVCRIVRTLKNEGKITSKGRWTPPKGCPPFYINLKQNFDITNLECISRAELARRNYNPTKTGMTNSKHYQKIKTAILLGKQITPEMPFAKKFI